jgi:hypothetical protein
MPVDPKPIPPSADAAKPTPAAPGATTTLPAPVPSTVSAFPQNGIVLAPDGGTVIFGGATPVDASRFYVGAEWLRWKVKKDEAPPLVTTGPASFPVAFLGNPGTRVLYGGEIDPGTLSGVRLTAGLWLDGCHTCAIEASGFCFNEKTASATFNSSRFPVLARPFRDVNPGGPNSEFSAFPGLASGSIAIRDPLQFCGAALTARCPFWTGCWGSVDAVGGLEYLNLREHLSITENILGLPGNTTPGAAGARIVVNDSFKTRNQFYGALVGADAHTTYGNWTFGLRGQIGVGMTREEVDINGSQVIRSATGAVTTASGGLLAIPGNIGHYTKSEFGFVPQLGLTVGYRVCEWLEVFGGYDCLYWQHVLRPGTEIDPVLNVNRIPNFGGGPAATASRPIVPFSQQSFWAQGVSAGVKVSW